MKQQVLGQGPLLTPQTYAEIAKLPAGTVARASMELGVREHEPLLIAMDAMVRYAQAYRKRNESTVGDDGALGEPFEDVIRGLRALLDGDGAVAMERGITTDSKDNGVIESLYWTACAAAGIEGD